MAKIKELVCEGLAISQMTVKGNLVRIEYDQKILHPDYPKCPYGRTVVDGTRVEIEKGDDYFVIKPLAADPVYIKHPCLGWAAESQISKFFSDFRSKKDA